MFVVTFSKHRVVGKSPILLFNQYESSTCCTISFYSDLIFILIYAKYKLNVKKSLLIYFKITGQQKNSYEIF